VNIDVHKFAREASIASETAAIRTEVLEMEVESLTKEIVEGRANRAAAVHRLNIFIEDLSRSAQEVGEIHAAICIGLEEVLMDSEENTYEVVQQHKHILVQLVQEEQARKDAETALQTHLEKSKGKAAKIKEVDLQTLRKDLDDSKGKSEALEEEMRLTQDANNSNIAMLTDLLEETQSELEHYKSSKTAGRLEQRRQLMRQMSLDEGQSSP